MRYCVSGRQPYSVLKKADEIKVQFIDKDIIMDFVEKIPDKTIILDVPGDEEDWATWAMYNEKFYEFFIALHDLSRAAEFNQANIKWYWPYPITTYYELGMIMNLHPSYVMIGQPLSFDLDRIVNHLYDDCSPENSKPVPLRMVVNVAHPRYLPTNGIHGICGQWVRPEDAAIYSTRIQCFEFEDVDLKQEEVLLQIYKEHQTWPGNLNLLIKKLDFNVDNRAIPEELGERRMVCGHKCWSGSGCHFCVSALQFAEQVRKIHASKRQKTVIDNK
jgi:hypothetical protein